MRARFVVFALIAVVSVFNSPTSASAAPESSPRPTSSSWVSPSATSAPTAESQRLLTPRAKPKKKPKKKPPKVGDLAVLIEGLSSPIASVTVKGPQRVSPPTAFAARSVPMTQRLTGLKPGWYVVTANKVSAGGQTFVPYPASTKVKVAARALSQVQLKYVPVSSQPSVLVVLTDDQPKGMLAAMPQVLSQLAAKGVTYDNAVVPTGLCCPSRASLLTGLYSTSTGVFGNTPKTYGGYRLFKNYGNEQRTLAVELERLGYVNGLFGKYLNGYSPSTIDTRPPGWHQFSVFDATHRSGYYRDYSYTVDADPALPVEQQIGQPLQVTGPTSEYSTTKFGSAAERFIREVPADKPVFTMYAPYGPHSNFSAEAKYRNTGLSGTKLLDDPSFDEDDVSDKPAWVRAIGRSDKAKALNIWMRQTETLRSVDDQVGNLIKALEDTGRLSNTLIVFTSDNGYSHGQHRVFMKNIPYRTVTNVDLIVRYPRTTSAAVDSTLSTANVDVAATILSTVGAPADQLQGRALLRAGNAKNPVQAKADPRKGIPLMASIGPRTGIDRPAYCGWRTLDSMFVEYSTGEQEFYDLQRDPFELVNRAADPAYADEVQASYGRARSACATGMPPDFGDPFNGVFIDPEDFDAPPDNTDD